MLPTIAHQVNSCRSVCVNREECDFDTIFIRDILMFIKKYWVLVHVLLKKSQPVTQYCVIGYMNLRLHTSLCM